MVVRLKTLRHEQTINASKINNLLGRLHIHQGNQLVRLSQEQARSKSKAEPSTELIGGSSSVTAPVYKCGIHNYETTNVKDWSTHAKEYSHGENSTQAVKGLMQMFGLASVDYSNGYQSKPRPEPVGASAAYANNDTSRNITELLRRCIVS